MHLDLVTPDRLREFFTARSIALVGASDGSGWARNVVQASEVAGFTGPLVPVHPTRPSAFGRDCVPSLLELAEPVDLAFVLAPTHAVGSVLDQAAEVGIRHAVVLASGYREVGAAGEELQDRLTAQAVRHGITVLGPNCLGYVNAHAGTAPFALTIPPPLLPGPVGLVLQSGALATAVLDYARAHAIGISLLATMGNESMIGTVDVLRHLVADEATRVICLFLEAIADPAGFAAAASAAAAAGKPVVVLKVGSSAVGQASALAHTGSVAGDDAVVDAFLRQLNVIRVSSLEDLLATAALLGYHPVPRGPRVAVLTSSGGACDIIADRAAEVGLEIPDFAPATAAAIAAHLPSFGNARNPLDTTGYVLANERTGPLTAIDHALDAAVADPGMDVVLFAGLLAPPSRPLDDRLAALTEARTGLLADRIRAAPIPVVPVSTTGVDISPYARELVVPQGLTILPGLDLTVRALGRAVVWGRRLGRSWSPGAWSPASGPPRVWSEWDARALLGSAGVPLVPAELVSSADEAVSAARRLGLPVVLKACAPGLAHKTDLGAVALGLSTEDQVRTAYRRVLAAVVDSPEPAEGNPSDRSAAGRSSAAGAAASPAGLTPAEGRSAAAPEAAPAGGAPGAVGLTPAGSGSLAAGPAARTAGDPGSAGVLVSPMVGGGVELLVGVTVDPAFGPVLAVGLGGVWVEVLRDTSLRVLPVDHGEVLAMLAELRGAAVLRGARGTEPVDLDAVAEAVLAVARAAVSTPAYTVEVNPLWVRGADVAALDALVVSG